MKRRYLLALDKADEVYNYVARIKPYLKLTMLDNTVLDIIIGLSFIYFLYSLMATAILEFLSGLFNFRGKMLDRGIQQMLDGRNFKYSYLNYLINTFRFIIYFIKSKLSNIRVIAYENPFLYHYQPTISKEIKLKRNLFLSSKYILTEVTKVGQKSINRGKIDNKSILFSSLIVNHPLYFTSTENARYSEQPNYLASDRFSDIMLDVLSNKLKPKSQNDQPILLKDIQENLLSLKSLNPHLYEILSIYITQANGDLIRFRWLIEIWYNQQMERLTGWYKRQTSYLLYFIGLLLAVSFNIDSIEIVRRLERDPNLAKQIGDGATAYITSLKGEDFDAMNASQKIDTLYRNRLNGATSIIGLGWQDFGVPIDSLTNVINWHINLARQLEIQCQQEHNKLRGSVGSAKITLDSNSMKDRKQEIDELYTNNIQKIQAKIDENKRKMKIDFVQKVKFVFFSLLGLKMIGLAITALGISFGSQFWFDLLSKFINIRSTGGKPANNGKKNGTISKTAKFNLHPDADSFG